MNVRRVPNVWALCVALSFSAGMSSADTPPWWSDTQKPPASDSTAKAPATPPPAANAPMLEEYTITRKPVETVDERAQQRSAVASAVTATATAAPTTPVSLDHDDTSRYAVQPGDLLVISVWHEPDLTREVRVSPDGWITYPLVGEVAVEGATIESLRQALESKMHKYIPEAVVDVSVKEPAGNRVYVLGKVNRPGVYPFTKSIDVVQALSLAGGTSKFASLNDIKILRRVDGAQQTYKFRYSDVERGRSLDQNIVLRSGDVVVVP